MAAKDADGPAPEEGEAKSSKLKWIIIGCAGLVLLGTGVGGTMFALGLFGSPDAEAAAQAQPAEEPRKEANYVSLEPAFTVNFQGNSRARFLQVAVDVMTREPAVEEELKRHMPVIRNNLVMLLSSKTSGELSTKEGKQQLRDEALASIQQVLERETGRKGVEAVYFTSFVMQ